MGEVRTFFDERWDSLHFLFPSGHIYLALKNKAFCSSSKHGYKDHGSIKL